MATLKQELDALVDYLFPGNTNDSRDKSITYMHYGWDGKGGKSLQETGDEFKLTRERARQISSRISSLMSPHAKTYLTTLPTIIETLRRMAPASAERIEQALRDEIGDDFRIEGALKAVSLFSEQCHHLRVIHANGERFVILPDMEKTPSRVTSKAQKVCTHLGMAHIDEMLELLPGIPKHLAEEYVRDVLSSRDDHVWLDEKREWVWLKEAPRNRLVTCLHKMLSFYSSVTLEGAIHGSNRYFNKGKGKPRQLEAPESVVSKFINSWGEATCADNQVIRKTERFDPKTQPVDMEEAIVREIWATPERIMREKALENALVPVVDGQTHPKKYNFSIALNYSPLVRKGKERGQYIPNGSI